MEILDVTVPIRTGMVIYPGDPDVRLERVRSIAEGASNNLTRIDMGAHSGTHIDAPVHFIEDGAGAEELPVGVLLGPCTVVEADGLAESDVRAAPEGVERLLFKTPNSELWARDEFPEEFARLDGAGARLLVERGVALVGVDYLSVGDQEAHTVLLGAGVVCVEGLDLREAAPGEYFLVCAPLKLVGSDGAPARVYLVRGLGVSRQG
jgi:arylformamidase